MNLAEDPGHRIILDPLGKVMDTWINETGDIGQFPSKKEDVLETEGFNYDKV